MQFGNVALSSSATELGDVSQEFCLSFILIHVNLRVLPDVS